MAETTQKPRTWGDLMSKTCVQVAVDTYIERVEDDDGSPPKKKPKVDNRWES